MEIKQITAAPAKELIASFPHVNPQYLFDWFSVFKQAEFGALKAFACYENNSLVGYFPFLEYKHEYGTIINSLPFAGYGGPIAKNQEALAALIKHFCAYCSTNGILAATISTPPFLEETQLVALQKEFKPDYQHENFYQYNFLGPHPLKTISSKHHQRFKREIAKSAQHGIHCVNAQTEAECMAWLEIYYALFERLGARPYPLAFMQALVKQIPASPLLDLKLAYKDEEMLGGILFLKGKKIIDYHFPAFTSEAAKFCPNIYILNQLFEELEETESWFNWESSPGKEGVYRFKSRWGAQEGNHYYLTKVFGDIAPLVQQPLCEIQQSYPGLFVLPYSLWTN